MIIHLFAAELPAINYYVYRIQLWRDLIKNNLFMYSNLRKWDTLSHFNIVRGQATPAECI